MLQVPGDAAAGAIGADPVAPGAVLDPHAGRRHEHAVAHFADVLFVFAVDLEKEDDQKS